MPRVVIFALAVLSAAALFVFGHTAPAYSSWPVTPWLDAITDGTWAVLLGFTALFITYATCITRCASSHVWFVALIASMLPSLMALFPCTDYLHTASHHWDYTDAGGDVEYQISKAEHVYLLSLGLSAILGSMATYGYFSRRKT
jgi:hypothetical protein